MGIRTGRQYIDSLRDGRQMWIDGELVADVTTDRRFGGAAYTMAELYDMQRGPKLVLRHIGGQAALTHPLTNIRPLLRFLHGAIIAHPPDSG